MENLASVRPFARNGGARDFSVRIGSDDSSRLAEHEQIQLAGWSEESNDGVAKRPDADDDCIQHDEVKRVAPIRAGGVGSNPNFARL